MRKPLLKAIMWHGQNNENSLAVTLSDSLQCIFCNYKVCPVMYTNREETSKIDLEFY